MMKNITLFLLLFIITTMAEAQPTLTAGTATIPQGGTAEISYTVNGFSYISTFNGTLTWDPAVLTYSSVSFLSTPFTTYPAIFNYTQVSAGILSFTWFHPISLGATLGSGSPVFKITFVASGSQGSSSVLGFSNTPEPIYYQDGNMGFGSYNTVNGLVTISGGGTNPPVANFTYGGNGLNWSFINSSTGSPTSYQWTFGDGNSSTQLNPTHSYATGGNYQVCLTATNANGSDSVCHMVYATGPPQANFSVSGTGLFHTFTNTSTGNPTSYGWTFGDGTTSTLQNPTHTYATYGTYQACLTAVNTNGNDSSCHIVYATMTVGVEDNFTQKKVVISFDPAWQTLNINCAGNAYQTMTATVFSLDGKTILTENLPCPVAKISLPNIKPGLYFVRVSSGEEVYTRKIMIP